MNICKTFSYILKLIIYNLLIPGGLPIFICLSTSDCNCFNFSASSSISLTRALIASNSYNIIKKFYIKKNINYISIKKTFKKLNNNKYLFITKYRIIDICFI